MSDFTSAISGVLGGISGVWNTGQQMANLNYQKNLQKEIFAREDNAVQRRAKDLAAAGLSKTLAAGSSAGAGSVVNTTSPQDDTVGRVIQGLGIKKAKADIENVEAQTANVLMDSKVKDDSLITSQYQRAKMDAERLLATGRFDLLGIEAQKGQQWINESMSRVDKINAEIDSIGFKNLLTQAQTGNINALTSKYGAETVNLAIQRAYINAQKNHVVSQTEKTNLEMQSEKIRQDMMQAQLTGFLLDNIRKDYENIFIENMGATIPVSKTPFSNILGNSGAVYSERVKR